MKEIVSTEKAPAAIGPYSQAVQVKNLLFVSNKPDIRWEILLRQQCFLQICRILLL